MPTERRHQGTGQSVVDRLIAWMGAASDCEFRRGGRVAGGNDQCCAANHNDGEQHRYRQSTRKQEGGKKAN